MQEESLPKVADCEHEYVDEYYGTRCTKCQIFYAYGCAPWDDPEEDEKDLAQDWA